MVNTYKCPGCGAPIGFKAGADQLVCEYCNTHVRVSELNDANDAYEFESDDVTEETAQTQDFNGYRCQSCGAELIVEEHTSATSCCYCGSSAVLQQRLEGIERPSGVIPFQIDKMQAKERFRKWLCTGAFTPSVFKDAARLEEIKGIYVPFWLYSYDAEIQLELDCTKVKRERKGDMEYTHTDHYRVERHGEASYKRIPVDASERMPDKVMDMLEPYNYNGIKEFAMPYLSGYESEKYNFSKDDIGMTGRVKSRVNEYIFKDVMNTVTGYSRKHIIRNNTHMRRKKAEYVLMPVWMITYRYKDEDKIFAINGQTGKQVGKLPNSMAKIFGTFGGITVALTAILTLLGGLLG